MHTPARSPKTHEQLTSPILWKHTKGLSGQRAADTPSFPGQSLHLSTCFTASAVLEIQPAVACVFTPARSLALNEARLNWLSSSPIV